MKTMEDKQYVEDFCEKQGLRLLGEVEPGMFHFEGGKYFDIRDIKWDIDQSIAPGVVLLYHQAGLDGASSDDYRTWAADHFEF